MSEEISPGSMKRANSNVGGLLMILYSAGIWIVGHEDSLSLVGLKKDMHHSIQAVGTLYLEKLILHARTIFKFGAGADPDHAAFFDDHMPVGEDGQRIGNAE
jgi:hypothetical protein